ncbi:DUF58 domain-containing protein [Acinetobacter puyangensis]|uniref:Uncharacterized conserved protein, DUF58 family, contains vWF domain n=1 Tax=Acinetobacter puyangensis TaxID=1096779 RepID=A0A240ED87_9GAMM|nr:DUF58 domain-containing protein [Acinetobacter puyangensis]SNX46667.1 Uncharacterized conserved protein, DUF58 family, contains vWF domain [Acinetobacter puyangensis]
MSLLKKYWQNWLSRRFQLKGSKTLAQRDVLVFFNREGYLYLVLLLITFIAGINYGNNLVLALCFLLSSILLLSFYLAFRQLYGLNITYEVAELGQAGQPFTIKFKFVPQKNQIHLHLRCEYLQQAKKITILKSPLVVQFDHIVSKRGLYQLTPLYFYSVYPFGIIRAWSFVYPQKQVWIAPRPIEVDLTQFGFKSFLQQQQQGTEDFSHLREFQSGDALNRIAWQQYAKGRGLLVKQFEEVPHHALNFYYDQMPSSLHEEKLGQLMYLVEQAYLQQTGFNLTLPSQSLPFGMGEQHYDQARLMLAQEP